MYSWKFPQSCFYVAKDLLWWEFQHYNAVLSVVKRESAIFYSMPRIGLEVPQVDTAKFYERWGDELFSKYFTIYIKVEKTCRCECKPEIDELLRAESSSRCDVTAWAIFVPERKVHKIV